MEGILDINAEIPDRALDLGMAEQKIALVRTWPPLTISPMRILTTSLPRGLPSMAKSNSARSRGRRS
jgi:hypothetical protein